MLLVDGIFGAATALANLVCATIITTILLFVCASKPPSPPRVESTTPISGVNGRVVGGAIGGGNIDEQQQLKTAVSLYRQPAKPSAAGRAVVRAIAAEESLKRAHANSKRIVVDRSARSTERSRRNADGGSSRRTQRSSNRSSERMPRARTRTPNRTPNANASPAVTSVAPAVMPVVVVVDASKHEKSQASKREKSRPASPPPKKKPQKEEEQPSKKEEPVKKKKAKEEEEPQQENQYENVTVNMTDYD